MRTYSIIITLFSSVVAGLLLVTFAITDVAREWDDPGSKLDPGLRSHYSVFWLLVLLLLGLALGLFWRRRWLVRCLAAGCFILELPLLISISGSFSENPTSAIMLTVMVIPPVVSFGWSVIDD